MKKSSEDPRRGVGKAIEEGPGGNAGSLARRAVSFLAVLALVACGGPGGSDVEGGGDEDASQEAVQSDAGGDDAAADSTVRINLAQYGIDAGDPDAPIKVVEFSDFGCPHCQRFHMDVYPTVYEEYVEAGHVTWKYIPYVLGSFPNSLPATRVGECAAEQDAFPAMRDRIFEEQQAWMESEQPEELFLQYAEEEGLDAERLRTCLDEGWREERVRQTIQVGRQLGIRGTPTFMIQGQYVQGNRPPEFFREVFDQILAEENGVEAPGSGGSQGS